MSGPGVSTLPFRMVREASATDTMSIQKPVITRGRQMSGEFYMIKEGQGRARVRVMAFRTSDGYVGTSAKWDKQEAYDKALKVRAAAQAAAPAVAVKPAPEVQLLHSVHESTLFSEVERRGYAVCPADLLGLDRNGEALAIDVRVAA